MSPTIQDLIQQGAARADQALDVLLPGPDQPPHSIHRAMRHSVFAGGKRLRPTLCYEAWRLCAGDHHAGQAATSLGAALEMIHTYSLIHDDLPALDDDDLRRGQPTCHKAFGEAIAILAGDALQTLAFQTIGALHCPAETVVTLLREVSRAIGTGVGSGNPDVKATSEQAAGMIGGQVLDLESEGKPPTAELVEQIHRSKTGALITVAIIGGGHVAGASQADVERLRSFGESAGLAFQIIDDVLDVTQTSTELGKTAGKDTATVKATWPAVFGVERSRRDAQELIADAFHALEPFGAAAEPLKGLALYLVDRKS